LLSLVAMRPYLAILRPNNILLTLFTQGVFMIAASRTSYFNIDWSNIIWPESLLIILTCCLTAAGGYIINDLFDVETDHINRPNKRILKRDISHKAAIVYYIILTAIGQICGYYAGLGIGLFASAIADGLSPAEAYRKVYDCSNSTNATVMANANRLLNDGRITLLLEPVFQAKREMVINDELATRRFIMQELFEHAKNTERVSDKLRALEMMGKSIGMFNDTADKDENDLDVEKLKGELKAKMASMLSVTLPSAKH